jgi:hypothetical protein
MRPRLFLLFFILAAALPATTHSAAVHVDGQAIRAHTAFLADDLLEGREAGERGYDIQSLPAR